MQHSRIKVRLIGGLAVVVAVIAVAFALGGSGSSQPSTSGTAVGKISNGVVETSPTHPPSVSGAGTTAAIPAPGAPAGAGEFGAAGSGTGQGATASAGGAASSGVPAQAPGRAINAADVTTATGVAATRIVKTGSLDLRVAKGAVQSTVGKLTALATAKGGYVSSSTTDTNSSNPSGQVELRVPVAQFADTVAAAEAFGHVELLTTSAHDVTGKYVDLNARKQALQRTRSTYLTILSRATTIGATLSVQQRIDDIQQQIDELKGEIKLLGSQSSYSTLDVNVDQPAIFLGTKVHHERHGLGKAWHTSISRFNRGIDAIVSGLGPLLLAVLLIGLAAGIARLGLRGARRHGSSDAAS